MQSDFSHPFWNLYEPVLFDKAVTITAVCTFDPALNDGDTIRRTVDAEVFARDRITMFTTSVTVGEPEKPKKTAYVNKHHIFWTE